MNLLILIIGSYAPRVEDVTDLDEAAGDNPEEDLDDSGSAVDWAVIGRIFSSSMYIDESVFSVSEPPLLLL